MPTDRCSARRKKLVRILRSEKLPALLVTNETNVRYLTGFTGDSSFLLLGPDVELLISDTRYGQQIKEECGDLQTYVRDSGEEIVTSVGRIAKKSGLKTIGFESKFTTHAQWTAFQQGASDVEWRATKDLVVNLRQIKDAGEIAEIRHAVDLAEKAFRLTLAALHPDMTEREASYELEGAIRRFGGDGVAFPSIVAVGDRAALPHYHPGSIRIKEADFVLFDWGALSPGGYRSDLTRVVATDRIRPKLKKVYEVVLSAQKRAIEKMRPGVSCKAVDAAARGFIARAGYGKKFGHGLGHGIGLDIHEWPRLSPISEAVLEPGMVITVEPGVYLPGWGGVRIEDDVLITQTGCEVLTSVPKELDEIPAI